MRMVNTLRFDFISWKPRIDGIPYQWHDNAATAVIKICQRYYTWSKAYREQQIFEEKILENVYNL